MDGMGCFDKLGWVQDFGLLIMYLTCYDLVRIIVCLPEMFCFEVIITHGACKVHPTPLMFFRTGLRRYCQESRGV